MKVTLNDLTQMQTVVSAIGYSSVMFVAVAGTVTMVCVLFSSGALFVIDFAPGGAPTAVALLAAFSVAEQVTAIST